MIGALANAQPGAQPPSAGATHGTAGSVLLSTVIAMLAKGETVARRLTVAEGLTVSEIFELLQSAEGLVGELPPPPEEGSLLPETYLVPRGEPRAAIVQRMGSDMQVALAQLWAARRPDLPLRTPEEALVLASIIEKETSKPEEYPLVAAVFGNRLRQGMPLQTDPTVIYGLGAGFDGNLRKRDLQTDTPYNTYTRTGLPPTPIALPGMASLQAALNPASSDALYFVARGDGSSQFSTNLTDHNRAVNKYQRGQP